MAKLKSNVLQKKVSDRLIAPTVTSLAKSGNLDVREKPKPYAPRPNPEQAVCIPKSSSFLYTEPSLVIYVSYYIIRFGVSIFSKCDLELTMVNHLYLWEQKAVYMRLYTEYIRQKQKQEEDKKRSFERYQEKIDRNRMNVPKVWKLTPYANSSTNHSQMPI